MLIALAAHPSYRWPAVFYKISRMKLRLLVLFLAIAHLSACSLMNGNEVKVIDGSKNKVVKLEDIIAKQEKKANKGKSKAEKEAEKLAAAKVEEEEASNSFLANVFGSGATGATEGVRPVRSANITFAKWETNPARALSKAKGLDRPVLLLFTALEWSPNARKLGDEVFASQSFNEFAHENLVLTYLDYPRDKLDTPDSMRRAKEKYSVTGYPTILLLNPDGSELYRKTGYLAGKSRDYYAEIRKEVLLARGLPLTPMVDPVPAEAPAPAIAGPSAPAAQEFEFVTPKVNAPAMSPAAPAPGNSSGAPDLVPLPST